MAFKVASDKKQARLRRVLPKHIPSETKQDPTRDEVREKLYMRLTSLLRQLDGLDADYEKESDLRLKIQNLVQGLIGHDEQSFIENEDQKFINTFFRFCHKWLYPWQLDAILRETNQTLYPMSHYFSSDE